MMISGYLDDASKTPWNEYKKGLIDLVISVVAVLTYMNFNSTTICFGADEIVIPKALFLILGVILGFSQRDELYGRRGWSVRESLQCDTSGVWRAVCAYSAEIRDGELFVPFGFVCLSVL